MNKLLAVVFLSVGLVASAWAQDPDLVRRAESGDVESKVKLANMYNEGQGVTQNLQKAFKWYLLAAEQGDYYARIMVGERYHTGVGVTQNYQEAVKWYKLAMEQGGSLDTRTAWSLAQIYGIGAPGVSQNGIEVARWLELEPERGEAIVQFMHDYGSDMLQEDKEVLWSSRLRAERAADAQFYLGYGFFRGDGFAQNYEEALKWFNLAARQGYASAHYFLGLMYMEGAGVAQNYSRAYIWFSLAAAKDISGAAEGRDTIRNRLSPLALERAQAQATLCLDSGFKECE